MSEADEIGNLRQAESERLHSEDKYGATGGEFLHRTGARGECCFAKATGLQWRKSVNRPNDPDVGDFEVRTRTQHEYQLIVRKDSKDRPYSLVTGTGPMFIVWGWIMAQDARRAEWLHSHGEREGAYFVPHSALRSINEIKLPHPPGHWSDDWLVDPVAKWNAIAYPEHIIATDKAA